MNIIMAACLRACVCACVRACMHVCERVCLCVYLAVHSHGMEYMYSRYIHIYISTPLFHCPCLSYKNEDSALLREYLCKFGVNAFSIERKMLCKDHLNA